MRRRAHALVIGIATVFGASGVSAQTPPGAAEAAAYTGVHAAAFAGDVRAIEALARQGADLNRRDGHGRTAAHIAAYRRHRDVLRALAAAGADMRAKDSRAYDIITIAAVADDPETVRLAIELGTDPKAITSPYDGTALIAAAHLGHDEVVRVLIKAGAPLDHVNNLGWTALMESVVLGDGGARHVATAKALVDAGAKPIPDREGVTPLAHARRRGYAAMAGVLGR
jgi:ankyrin repeat protein